ncbi:porin [Paraburkholderia caballeronis]|uniref:Outer membrane protein (Porin) n=1 Tax=Paraburkholderia caballeronis TaxID=416943 RepID=A0A1H7EZ54_9BURK|nr:porin [Paraburkholderia caballeronis]PXW23878.1 putative porin [Paraburkholderia caballeronis]PXW99642.1 putative porin [Paraburkholderia caballeronis]RAJ96596.1 putative porin [Paraburkholderia caballeronis]TDV15584.1 putative porin [Paraburkholderia caballeronis]TDV17839.1 putative porin [Paraburkholderia caballeronis]
MKRIISGAGLALICCAAHAQSSVTLYGLIDEAVRFQTSGAGNTFGMNEGAVNGNRFGLKGVEELGGGTRAIFQLESGFNIATGKSDQQSQLFGRFAWVGLQNDTFGTLKAGRQYGGIYNFYAFNFDPIGGGNINATDWSLFLVGIRFDNTLQYENRFGPVALQVQRSFGGQPGSNAAGSTTTASLIYNFNGGKVGVAGAESKDGGGHKLVVGSLGGTYAWGPLGLYLYGIDARRDAGFSVGATNTSAPLANTNIISNVTTVSGAQTSARNDVFVRVGATYQLAPQWRFIASYAYDHANNVAPGRSGTTQTVYGIADYILSKRTDVYVEVDHSHLSGASVDDPNGPLTFAGKANNFGASVSLRTLF